MTDQILYRSKYARSNTVDLPTILDNEGLRVYRDSPYSIHVQVRTRTEKQGRISGLSISRKQALDLAEYLTRKAAELRDE